MNLFFETYFFFLYEGLGIFWTESMHSVELNINGGIVREKKIVLEYFFYAPFF
jgi:hypothetical protein